MKQNPAYTLAKMIYGTMKRNLFGLFFILICFLGKSQCPQLYNYLGNLSSAPQFISCTGGAYAMNVQSNTNIGPYTISWGDATPNSSGPSLLSTNSVPHTYAAATSTYPLVLTIPSLNCTLTSIVIMELQSNAVISIPNGFPTYGCAPKTLTFQNTSTDVSANTSFTFMAGDGTPAVIFNASNAGQQFSHAYAKGSVPTCAATASLFARNFCNVSPSLSQYGPLQIYDIDAASIASDLTHCLPDNTFIFANSTNRNCLPQGNTFQRQEKWNSGSWNPWPPSTPFTITYPGIGQYTVTLLDSNLCGVDTAIRIVNIVAPPTASLIAPPGNLCQNVALTFTNASFGGGNAFSWDFGDASPAVTGGGNKSHTYTNPGTYTITLVASITGANSSCTSTVQTVVTILASPVSSFTLSPAVGCNSLSVTFTNTSTGASTYTWSFGNGNTSSLQNPLAENYLISGLFTATLAVTATTSCKHSSTQTLIVRPNPVPVFVPFAACVGAAVTFTNNSTPVSGVNSIVSYTWNFGDQSGTSPSLTPIHTYTAPGTYTVKLIAATAFCADTLKQTVTINVKPTANFVPTPTAGCPALAVTFSNTSINAATYLWKFLSGLSATSSLANPSFTFVNTSQNFQNYTVTLIASIGACVDSIKKNINVWPKPVANFTTSTITGCSPLLTTFTNNSVGYASSNWNFGDGVVSFLQSPNHTYTNTSLFTTTLIARLIVTNSLSCTDSVKKLITVYPEALTVFTMVPSSGCSPLHVNFISVPGVAVYTWNHGDGSPTYTTLTAHAWTYTNTTNTNQTSVVSLTAQTSNGCIGTGSGSVTIFYNPIANYTATPGAGCSPLVVTFSNTSTGNASSKWQFNNGHTSAAPNPATTFTNATGADQFTYTVKLVVGTSDNCYDSITKPIILFAQPKAGLSPDTPACSPKTIKLTSSSQGSNFYKWTFGDGQSISTASSTITHFYVNTIGSNQTFLVKLAAVSPNLCMDSITVPIVVHPKPNYFISSAPDSGCSPLKVHFDSIQGVKQYQWKYDGISFSSSGNIINLFENKDPITRTINIELIARDVFTCADTANKQVKIFPVPTAKFSAKPINVFIPNQPTFFTNESSPQNLIYQWDFGDGATSADQSPAHTYGIAGEFQSVLIVTNSNGCKDTFALPNKVIALDETTVEVPNAFTPNTTGPAGTKFDPSDTSNDIFHPNVKGTEKYEFSVYSRWGELLFDTKDPDEGWDGYYKGKLCTQDVYIWKITANFIDGRKYVKTGDLLLLK